MRVMRDLLKIIYKAYQRNQVISEKELKEKQLEVDTVYSIIMLKHTFTDIGELIQSPEWQYLHS